MPELPELQVVVEVLQRRVVGQVITRVEVLPPGGAIVVRDLAQTGFVETVKGATIAEAYRRDKFVILGLRCVEAASFYLAINPKLTGRLQLAAPEERRHVRTALVLTLANGRELRYFDQKTMGQIYLTRALDLVPEYAGKGPEPLAISVEEFQARLKPFRGEIKGILTRGKFVAGIGNAYADEILWAARLHPYRKRTQLTPAEIARLYEAMQRTLREATDRLRLEMGEDIHLEPRKFLAVHLKTGEACPRCGTAISLVRAHQRITNFCRTCQPGGLIRGM